jgi:hypothetical protein
MLDQLTDRARRAAEEIVRYEESCHEEDGEKLPSCEECGCAKCLSDIERIAAIIERCVGSKLPPGGEEVSAAAYLHNGAVLSLPRPARHHHTGCPVRC